MNRAEMLEALGRHPVPISVNGSTPLPLNPEWARHLAGSDDEIRVMDMTIIPDTLRAYLKDDGSFDGRRVRERSDD